MTTRARGEVVRNIYRTSKQQQTLPPSTTPIFVPFDAVDHSTTQQGSELIGLGPFLLHDIPGRLDYVRRTLLTAETTWGPIDHWAFSFQRRWRDARQEQSIEYTMSKARTLVELGRRAMILLLHLLDGIEGGDVLEDYRWVWIEALRLSGTINDGVVRLEQQMSIAAEAMYK